MSRTVIDASVTVKWFVPEEFTTQSLWLRRRSDDLLVPGHWRTEHLNALWKKLRKTQELTEQEFTAAVRMTLALSISEVPVAELYEPAVDLAARYDRTVYDSLYVALALREGCSLVTADRRLYNALSSALPDTITWLGDLSEEDWP